MDPAVAGGAGFGTAAYLLGKRDREHGGSVGFAALCVRNPMFAGVQN